MGLLSLSEDGRLICLLCDKRRDLPEGQKREYNSYCGFYEFDGKELPTRVDATANPAFLNTDQIRDVSFEGDVMVLKPTKNTGPISDGQRVLRWTKL